jgi:hemin uptake protein HemP
LCELGTWTGRMVDVKQNSDLKEPVPEQPATKGAASAAKESLAKERYGSDELFGDRKEILIVHNEEIYRLRRTRHDKLILYK